MNKIKKIGLFDSGMGGLSILKVLLQKFPGKDFVYFADTLNLPYGEKSKEDLQKCCIKVKDFLLSLDANTLVIACNAASCLYLNQTHYKNIPLINVISPTVKKLMEVSSENDRIGILATPFTVRSNVYLNIIKSLRPQLKVFQKATPDLAPLVERGFAHHLKCKEALKNHLQPLLKQNINILVLGCTHYFFLKDEIKQILPSHIKIVDPLDDLDVKGFKDFKTQNKIQKPVHLGDVKNFKENKSDSNVQIYMTQEQPEFVKAALRIIKNPQNLSSTPSITILNSF